MTTTAPPTTPTRGGPWLLGAQPARRDRGRSLRRLVVGLALAVLSGVLAVLSFGPYRMPFIWFAFVPMVVAQYHVLPRRLSLLAPGVAIGLFYQGLFSPTVRDNASSPWYLLSFGLWVGIAAALIGWRSRSFQERTGFRWLVLSVPLAWTAVDFVRGSITSSAGATYGDVALAVYKHPVVLQPMSVFTLHALNFLILAVNYALGLLCLEALRRDSVHGAAGRGRRLGSAAVIAAMLVGWLSVGALRMATPAPTVRVAAVQPGASTPGEEWARDVAMTRQAAQQGAKLVVWHEVALRFDPRLERTAELTQLARDTGVYLVVGWGMKTGPTTGLNEALTIGPDGRVLGSYSKVHPATVVGEHSRRNTSIPTYLTPFGRLGTIICLDIDYTNTTRDWARRGVGIIAAPSQDNPGITSLHYTQLALRAAENRVSMVKADLGYDSAIVDPYGRILRKVETPHKGQALVVGDVAVGTGRTPASRLPDWFGWVAVALTAGFLIVGARGRLAERAAA